MFLLTLTHSCLKNQTNRTTTIKNEPQSPNHNPKKPKPKQNKKKTHLPQDKSKEGIILIYVKGQKKITEQAPEKRKIEKIRKVFGLLMSWVVLRQMRDCADKSDQVTL